MELHYLEWRGEAPKASPTVLIHGFLDFAWSWQGVVRAGLEGRRRIIAPDMRGHGDSDSVGAGGYYHFADYIADLSFLLSEIAPGPVNLVGHSMGGMIAAYFAGAFPERVERLALLEGLGPPEDNTPRPIRVKNWIKNWKARRKSSSTTYAGVAEAARRLRRNDSLLTEELAFQLAEHGTLATSDGRYRFKHDPLHLSQGPYPFDREVAFEFFRNIRCPVLIVDAAESEFAPMRNEAQQRIAEFRAHRRVVIESAGHMMQRHQPAALAKILNEFLEE